jgi:hypothetical protein
MELDPTMADLRREWPVCNQHGNKAVVPIGPITAYGEIAI